MCFGDDSGVNTPCNCFAVALVCFKRRPGIPLLKHGAEAYLRLLRMLGWKRGELKYRRVARRASKLGLSIASVMRVVWDGAAAALSIRMHSAGRPREERLEAVRRLLEALGEQAVLVLDHGLVPGDESSVSRELGMRVKFASSGKTPGVQLADIAAGACYHGITCSYDEC